MQLEVIKNAVIKIFYYTIYKMSRISITNPIVILITNSLIASIALFLSIQLRIGISFFSFSYLLLINNLFVFGLVSASIFIVLQINNQSLHNKDINKLLLSVLIANILYIPLMYLMFKNIEIPLVSTIITNIFVMSCILMGVRYVYNIAFKPKSYILLLGNSDSISLFLNSYNNTINNNLDNIGIINTNPKMQIDPAVNVPVIGNIADLNYIISTINISQVIITDNDLSTDDEELLFVLSKHYKFLVLQTNINKYVIK